MRLILLGPPGAGKGTQAVKLSEKLNIPHISTGDIFRSNIKEGTQLGKRAKEYIDKGLLVPDEITVGIVKDRLSKDDCKNGFILDGFPRTIPQAEYLDEALSEMSLNLDFALDIEAKDDVIIKRLSGRRVCPKCGATYHIKNNKPQKEGICDQCGDNLIQRDDDKEQTIAKRLETYHEQTEPLTDYYNKKNILVRVSDKSSIEATFEALLEVLGVKK